MKVSVVLPVFNGADFLDEAIQSVLAQTHADIELIVVNDGSTDNGATEQIALGYGSRLRYFRKENGGVASALNLGIREMRGDYFSWLSHDDIYLPAKIEQELSFLAALPDEVRQRAIAYSDYVVFAGLGSPERELRMKQISPGQFRYWITTENVLHGCTLLIPKTAFEECGLFDESLRTTQDYDLWFRLAARYQFFGVPRALVKARSHSGQGSLQMATLARAECEALLSGFIRQLQQNELTEATGRSTPESYVELASNMWSRGFQSSGWVAVGQCLRGASALRRGGASALLRLMEEILRWYVARPLRARLSGALRALS